MWPNSISKHAPGRDKRISAGTALPAVRGCGSRPSFFPDGMGVLFDPVSKTGYFYLFRETRIPPTRPELLTQRLASAAFVRQAARDGKIPVSRDSKKYPPFFLMAQITPPSCPGKKKAGSRSPDGGKDVACADAFILHVHDIKPIQRLKEVVLQACLRKKEA